MFALLTPAALLALLGLLVPVAIHLWNRRPGREVAVGSLRWLAAGANRRLRNLKLEQLGLLLLRAALLAVLAVAVAGPVWRTALPASRGVVLLSPGAAGNADLATLRPTIDSLRRRGYALRWLRKGFPGVSGASWRALSAGTGLAADSAAANGSEGFAWARVQQAASIFPGQPMYVVTTAALRDFQGSHPPLPASVTWQYLPDTTTAFWGQAAVNWGKRGDSLRLLVGRSTATQTTFRTETIRLHNEKKEQFRVPGLPPLRLDTVADGGRLFMLVPVRPGAAAETPIDGPPQVIEIYASPAYASDARYLEAALRAAATGLLQPPVLRRITGRPAYPGNKWLFWLSDEPLPKFWQKNRERGAHIWREAAGPGVADTAQLATTETLGAPITVFRRGTAQPAPADQLIWADSQGQALLSRQTRPTGTFYQLHTRLNPAWSTLADDPQLPARLLRLLQPEPTDETPAAATALDALLARHDQRALDPAQLLARRATATPQPPPRPSAVPAFRTTDLRPWLVLLAGLLLLLERWLARRRESLPQPATS